MPSCPGRPPATNTSSASRRLIRRPGSMLARPVRMPASPQRAEQETRPGRTPPRPHDQVAEGRFSPEPALTFFRRPRYEPAMILPLILLAAFVALAAAVQT